MSNTYLDDFMDKMITVPNDINRYLRLIRKLDKRVEDLQIVLNHLQGKFLAQVKELRERKGAELPPQLKVDYEVILRKQRELFGYAKEKKEISDQLYSEVREYQEMLAVELKNKYKEKPEEEILKRKKMKMDANKFSAPNKKEDFYYDSKDPQYCYCGGASFGEMVACENPYCEREWFHTTCIEEKNLPEKWYCSDCQKQREKTRNPTSRGYFVNKDGTAA
jgi:hypothetical protein